MKAPRRDSGGAFFLFFDESFFNDEITGLARIALFKAEVFEIFWNLSHKARIAAEHDAIMFFVERLHAKISKKLA